MLTVALVRDAYQYSDAVAHPHRHGIRLSDFRILPYGKPYQPDGSCYRTDDAGIEQSVTQHPCQHHHDELRPPIAHLYLWHHGYLRFALMAKSFRH